MPMQAWANVSTCQSKLVAEDLAQNVDSWTHQDGSDVQEGGFRWYATNTKISFRPLVKIGKFDPEDIKLKFC